MQPKPPNDLFEKIIKRIQREKRVFVFRKIVLFSASSLGLTVAFAFSLKVFFTDVFESGFFYFVSLIFSDFSTVTSYWQSFAMIILETLPAATTVLVLSLLAALLQSLKSLNQNIKVMTGAAAG